MLAGNTATLITNQPDIARWSKTKTGAMWSQLFVSGLIKVSSAYLETDVLRQTNPIAVTLSASLGILATAAINNNWYVEA
jgi:NCS1 family nucleobase:cation symporter-1